MSQTEVQLIKDAVIVNADISNSAAIDVSKLSGVMPSAGGSFTDDVTFTGASANIVFDKSDNALEYADNAKAIFGTGSDFEIFHNGSQNIVGNNATQLRLITDALRFRSSTNSETYAQANLNGAFEAHYDNVKKFETRSNGITVTGYTYSDGVTIGNGTAEKYLAGDSNQLQMYHTGSSGNGYINNTQGTLLIGGSVVSFTNQANNAFLIRAVDGGTAELYHNGSKKFETTSSGVTVTGTINFGSGMGSGLSSNGFNINFADSNGAQDMVKFGTSGDLRIFHDGSHSRIDDAGTGSLLLQTNGGNIQLNKGTSENMLIANIDAAVELYYDNSKKLETTSQGVTIPDGNGLTINGGTGNRTGVDAVLYVDKTNNNDWTAKFKTNSGSSTDYGIRIECNSGSSFPLAINSGSDVFRVSGSGAVYATEYQGSGLTLSGVHKSYAILLERLSDTDVGTFTSGAYRTRNLNVELDDPDGIVSLSSNQFTLSAGTYIIRWSCSAFQVDHHSTRIAHISGSVTNGGTELGSSEYSNNGSEVTNRSVGVSLQACANSCVYEIQHRCTQTVNGNGFGVRTMFGVNTIATIVEIFKIA